MNVYIQTDIEGNVTLRGSSSFTVLIDGKPTVLDGSDALQQIPASLIESIEIITNPSAKYDPDGTAGIINVITKKTEAKGLTGQISASTGTGPFKESLVEMKLERITLGQMVGYLKLIESPDKLVSIKRISIQSNKKETQFLDAILQVLTFTN